MARTTQISLLAAAATACEFNAEVNIAPQSVVGVEPLVACPSGASAQGVEADLDLLLVSDFDRLAEQGSRVRRRENDHCTIVGGQGTGSEECEVSVAFADETAREAGSLGEGQPIQIREGDPDYCDANGRCGVDAGAGAPLHLAIVVDNGEEVPALDPNNQRISALQGLVLHALCAGLEDSPIAGCPFSIGDEVRLWLLVDGSLREQGGWTSDFETADARLVSMGEQLPSGDGPIYCELGDVAQILRQFPEDHGRAIVLVTTDGITSGCSPESVPADVPIHVVSLVTTPDAEAGLRAIACPDGSYQAVSDPSGYAAAMRRVRFALRGRWRAPVRFEGMPAEGRVWEVTASATVQIEGADAIVNPQLSIRVQ